MKNIRIFYLKNFPFAVVIFSIYLKRRVFICWKIFRHFYKETNLGLPVGFPAQPVPSKMIYPKRKECSPLCNVQLLRIIIMIIIIINIKNIFSNRGAAHFTMYKLLNLTSILE